jgi:hypothetical protein
MSSVYYIMDKHKISTKSEEISTNKPKGRIRSVLCPGCWKKHMSLTSNANGLPPRWQCPDCVIVYQANWFDTFFQFEDCVERETVKNFQDSEDKVK